MSKIERLLSNKHTPTNPQNDISISQMFYIETLDKSTLKKELGDMISNEFYLCELFILSIMML